jgi:hypothetical protein
MIEPDVTLIANCHTCNELVRFGHVECPNCGIKIDHEEIFFSLLSNYFSTQAISAANNLRTADIGVWVFLGVSLIVFVSNYPYWFSIVLTFFWLIPILQIFRWFRRYKKLVFEDEEFALAKKQLRHSAAMWVIANCLNAILIWA